MTSDQIRGLLLDNKDGIYLLIQYCRDKSVDPECINLEKLKEENTLNDREIKKLVQKGYYSSMENPDFINAYA